MTDRDYDKTVRDFLAGEVAGRDGYLDSLADAPLPLYAKFAQTGLMNWWMPAEHGGLGLSLEDSVRIVSALAVRRRRGGVHAVSPHPDHQHGHLVREPRGKGALPHAAGGGDGFCATLGSEHAAGSELTRIATAVRREGDTLVPQRRQGLLDEHRVRQLPRGHRGRQRRRVPRGPRAARHHRASGSGAGGTSTACGPRRRTR